MLQAERIRARRGRRANVNGFVCVHRKCNISEMVFHDKSVNASYPSRRSRRFLSLGGG
jgi:hypothetical protein